MKKFFWIVIVIISCLILLTVCSNTSTTENNGEFELLSTSGLGCAEEQPLEKLVQEGTLQWIYNEGVLNLLVDIDTHCSADFVNTVTFSGNTVTIMLEDVAEGVARCTCSIREEFSIKVTGTTEVRVICKVKYHNADYFEKIIDRNISLFF